MPPHRGRGRANVDRSCVRRGVAVGILVGYLLCLAISATALGRAHMVEKFRAGEMPEQRERVLERNERHLAYVAEHGHGRPRRAHARALRWVRTLEVLNLGPRAAICAVFHPCEKALQVAWCESRFSIYARNGQYLGLFQMGDYARSTYGHSWTAIGQARAAHAYYEDAGWGPWECA